MGLRGRTEPRQSDAVSFLTPLLCWPLKGQFREGRRTGGIAHLKSSAESPGGKSGVAAVLLNVLCESRNGCPGPGSWFCSGDVFSKRCPQLFLSCATVVLGKPYLPVRETGTWGNPGREPGAGAGCQRPGRSGHPGHRLGGHTRGPRFRGHPQPAQVLFLESGDLSASGAEAEV